MSEHGDRAGAGPAGPGRRRPPSRRMRERADEMADLLAHAAPAVRANRRRRSAAIPAAVVALGALTIGGVGVAVGLDSEPAGATALPGGPSVPADPGGQPIGPAETTTRNTSAVADVPVEPDDEQDESSSAGDDEGRPDLARPPVAVPLRSAAAPARPPRTTTDADDGDDGDDRPTSSRTTTSTSTRTTSRPRPTSTREADDEPSGSTTRSGRSSTPEDAPLRADDLGGRSVVPSGSPTGDDE